jgi:hypothetical protein
LLTGGPSRDRLATPPIASRIKNHRQGIAGGFGGLAKSDLISQQRPAAEPFVDFTQRYMIYLD